MNMSKIGFGTPIGEDILLYWQDLNHFEDGRLIWGEDGEMYHTLFDGEALNVEPTHWSYLPKIGE